MQAESGKIIKPGRERSLLACWLLLLLAIPLTIAFGVFVLDDRQYYFVSLAIVIETIVPFFLMFESRKPEAREVVLIAVLAAIAVAGRAAFFFVQQVSPVLAIIIIAGACLGAEAGFLTGSMTAFVSNFLFGQGPWTPWQMFAMGLVGFLAGWLVKRGWLKKKPLSLCIFGGVATMVIYGLIVDTCSLFTMAMVQSWAQVLAVYGAGVIFNIILAASTIFFLALLTRPLVRKIDRVVKKYGMMEE